MSKKKFKYLIIGAGPTGLGAAYRLKDLGETDFLVLERANHIGGLAASFKDDKGFTWDIGGHVQFSHYTYFDQLMEKALGKDGWLHHLRESWGWMQDTFVPYPVQNNIRYLPKEAIWKCVEGMIDCNLNKSDKLPANFEEWILATFGKGFSELFMLPYNYKVWAFRPNKMNFQWIGERVSVVDLKRVLKNLILNTDDISWGPNNTFQFPKHGGTGAIWDNVGALIGKDKIQLNSEVAGIDSESKSVALKNGDVLQYDHILSTMPLDLFCRILKPELPKNIFELSQNLKHSTSNIVGIGLKGKPPETLKTKCWMYFSESDSPFYRATVFSNYSPNNVPDINTTWSLMTETSESTDKPLNRAKLIEDTIQGCINSKLFSSKDEVISTWMYSAEHGYPTPSVERDGILKEVLGYLDSKKIWSRGRFGAWKYEVSNQDHSLMQGVEWVDHIVSGKPEVTVFHPNIVNAPGAKK